MAGMQWLAIVVAASIGTTLIADPGPWRIRETHFLAVCQSNRGLELQPVNAAEWDTQVAWMYYWKNDAPATLYGLWSIGRRELLGTEFAVLRRGNYLKQLLDAETVGDLLEAMPSQLNIDPTLPLNRTEVRFVISWRSVIGGGAVLASCVAIFYLMIRSALRFALLRRMRRGLCKKCKYQLSGLPTMSCPECGTVNSLDYGAPKGKFQGLFRSGAWPLAATFVALPLAFVCLVWSVGLGCREHHATEGWRIVRRAGGMQLLNHINDRSSDWPPHTAVTIVREISPLTSIKGTTVGFRWYRRVWHAARIRRSGVGVGATGNERDMLAPLPASAKRAAALGPFPGTTTKIEWIPWVRPLLALASALVIANIAVVIIYLRRDPFPREGEYPTLWRMMFAN
ncbi:MAG: hypothetical protein KDA20_10960 [Phycisphaerales bacterium]|nr:hypothetical protein [Phycisphaerales bacterium]